MKQNWLLALGLLLLAYFASAVLIPIFLALFLAVLLEPAVQFTMRFKMSRGVASGLVTIVFVLSAVLTLWVVYYYVASLSSEAPLLAERLRGLSHSVGSTLEKFNFSDASTSFFSMSEPSDVPKVQIVDRYPFWSAYLMRGVGTVYELATLGVFVPMMLSYFLIDKENLVESFNAVVGRHIYLPKLNSELPKMVRVFFVANFATGALLMLVQAAVFFVLGFRGSLALGALSGFVNLIPLMGAPIAMALVGVQGVLQFDHATPVVLALGIVLLTHLIAGNFMLPSMVGSRVNVSPAAMAVGLLFWSWLWGAVGFLLAVPMTALVKIVLESSASTYPLANLLAARPRHVMRGLIDDDDGVPEANTEAETATT